MTNEELAELERLLAEIDGKKKGQLTSLCLAYERLGRIVSRDRDYWIATAREAEALRAEIERLRGALRGVFEEWAGSEGFIPETAPEGYLLHLTKRMADIARAALKENPNEG